MVHLCDVYHRRHLYHRLLRRLPYTLKFLRSSHPECTTALPSISQVQSGHKPGDVGEQGCFLAQSFTDCIDIGRGQAPNPPALKLAARRSQIGFPNITDPDQAMQDERADFFCSDAELR